MRIFIILSFSSLLFVSGCLKKIEYPIEPKIDLRQLVVKDSVYTDLHTVSKYVSIYFKLIDGDGNFGIDTNATYYKDSLHRTNFYLKIFYLQNGNVFEYTFDENSNLNDYIPYVPPIGLNKYYKAQIIYDLQIPKFIQYPIKLEFYVEDNNFNKSNSQSTPWIAPDFRGIILDTNNLILD